MSVMAVLGELGWGQGAGDWGPQGGAGVRTRSLTSTGEETGGDQVDIVARLFTHCEFAAKALGWGPCWPARLAIRNKLALGQGQGQTGTDQPFHVCLSLPPPNDDLRGPVARSPLCLPNLTHLSLFATLPWNHTGRGGLRNVTQR